MTRSYSGYRGATIRRAAVIVLVAAVAAGIAVAFRSSGTRADDGSTLRATWIDRGGSGVLVRGPGQPFVDRTELAPRSRPTRTLATFAQITDVHVVDEESPVRLEMLDRLGPPYTSAFRPQESLTTQVLAAVVASLDREKPQAVVETGDLIDNDQLNELQHALAVLRGGRVDPNSGAAGYQGVQSASNPDPFFYRPDVDPPRHPGLLAEAERPFVSEGLRMPWYPVLGNHDVLVQGNLPPTPETQRIATGDRKLVRPDAAAMQAVREAHLSTAVVRALLAHGIPGTSMRIAADPRRRELSVAEVLRMLRDASGHGGSGPLLRYAFDIGPAVRGIVLDLEQRGGGAGGVLPPTELAWLRTQLARAGSRWVVVFSHQPLPESALAALDGDAHVVAAVAGDTHRNSIEPRPSAAGGYWLITTSSLIDWPQEARMFRLAQTADGRVVLQTWLVDGDPSSKLANVSRQLAYLDIPGGRPNGWAGGTRDRNANLYR
jgi:metallophosphoesterase (TIGR03767 family)